LSSLPNFHVPHFPEASAYLPSSEATERTRVRVIHAVEGQLITEESEAELEIRNGHIVCDPSRDILHLSVVNRYREAAPSHAFISGFGLKKAAIASSVAHDSHNIVVIGTDAELMKNATDALMENGGGIAFANAQGVSVLALPIAGLMSPEPGEVAAAAYQELTQLAVKHGSTPRAPFMLLSFMALLVIPALKLSDLGLFNGLKFAFSNLELKKANPS
jgi:adenine deaminase